MTFQVPESKRSIGQNQFTFTLPDGTEHTIPKAKYLTTGQVEKLSNNKGDISVSDILELFDSNGAGEAVRQLDTEQLQALLNAWQADSGLSTGE